MDSEKTSARRVNGYTIGVLVQTNFGGSLMIAGVPVGRELAAGGGATYGSCVMVIATDAPVDARNLKRIAARAIMGMARTGASGSNGSGDYAIPCPTAPGKPPLSNDPMSPPFPVTTEATEAATI